MAAAEDVIQMLDEQGQLETVRAHIRAKVISALHQGGILPNQDIPFHMTTETGRVVAELFRDFLKCNGLVSTLHVFEPESALPMKGDQLNQTAQKLGLAVSKGEPLIYQLVGPLIEGRGKQSDPRGGLLQQQAKAQPKADVKPIPGVERPVSVTTKPTIGKDKLSLAIDMRDSESPDMVSSSLGSNEHLAGSIRPRSKKPQLPALVGPGLTSVPKQKKDEYQDEIAKMLAGGKKGFSPYDDDIDEEIDDEFDDEPFESGSNRMLVESNGTSSLGADASVDSLALDQYDHIEEVKRNRLRPKF